MLSSTEARSIKNKPPEHTEAYGVVLDKQTPIILGDLHNIALSYFSFKYNSIAM